MYSRPGSALDIDVIGTRLYVHVCISVQYKLSLGSNVAFVSQAVCTDRFKQFNCAVTTVVRVLSVASW